MNDRNNERIATSSAAIEIIKSNLTKLGHLNSEM